MPRLQIRYALALLGALLCLAACAPAATAHTTPTATPTATPTPALAPTPTSIPAGWAVLTTKYFSIAYPPDWTVQTMAVNQAYNIIGPEDQGNVEVTSQARTADVAFLKSYCQPQIDGARPTTLAHLPMTFRIAGLAGSVRVWDFANARQTIYQLTTGDAMGSAAIRERDTAILTTFRPDDATPWRC